MTVLSSRGATSGSTPDADDVLAIVQGDVSYLSTVVGAPPARPAEVPHHVMAAHLRSNDAFRHALAQARAARGTLYSPRFLPAQAWAPSSSPEPGAPAPIAQPIPYVPYVPEVAPISERVVLDPVAAPAVLKPVPSAEPVTPRKRSRRGRRAAFGAAAVAVAVAVVAGAGATLFVNGHDAGGAASAKHAIASVDKQCLRQWNLDATAGAAQMRVTLGQFGGAYGRISRVDPIGGTLMAPNSCAVTVYDEGNDMHAILVAGVKGQDGYMDVTSYPRAKQIGWPKTASEANVTIESDGSLRAITS